jgi:hypothetical protein
MKIEVHKEHQWLQRLVGEWRYETEAAPTPGKAPEKCAGTETVRSLGGLWVLCEGRGEMPGGGTAAMVMTLGYDPEKGRYVGTWVGSMMTWLWLYEGTLDADQRVLTLDTEGPSFSAEGQPVPGKLARYRDSIESVSEDHRVLTSRVLGEDGVWQTFMTAHYQRLQQDG